MSNIESWVLGYLLNSMWQVPVIFAAGWIAARLVRRSGPRMEHQVWVGALMLEAVLPACSFRLGEILQRVWELALRSAGQHAPGGEVRVVIGSGATTVSGVLRLPATVLAAIAVAYGCSLLYFAGRLVWGLWRTHAMRRQAVPVTLTGEAAQRWNQYGRHFGIRIDAAKVATSLMIPGPVTVGVWHGVLLVPPDFLESIAEGDLDAVVAHEFAHMQRRDFAKNLFYGVLSLPMSYHPLLWLTRSRVAESREMVCDAMAAEAVAGRERYARSLLRLASMLAKGTPARTLHAIGIFDANIFERRVMSLTQRHVEIRGARRFAMAAACVVVGLATCASAMALRMQVSAPIAVSTAHSENPARLKVAPEIIAGNLIEKKNPVYPAEAKEKKDTVDGSVILAAIIGKDGSVQNLRVKKSLRADYDRSAIEAVKDWRYKPYLLNGDPQEVETTVTVTYSSGH